MPANLQDAGGVAGVGTDIADVARISKMLEQYGDAFLKKTFTDAEIKYCAARPDAALRFAGKSRSKACRLKTTNSARPAPCSTKPPATRSKNSARRKCS